MSTSTSTSQDAASPTSSRRTRNNIHHRANDIEFATDIGTSLLTEVRRLQALLLEKEEVIAQATSHKETIEREIETAHAARRAAEEGVGQSLFHLLQILIVLN